MVRTEKHTGKTIATNAYIRSFVVVFVTLYKVHTTIYTNWSIYFRNSPFCEHRTKPVKHRKTKESTRGSSSFLCVPPHWLGRWCTSDAPQRSRFVSRHPRQILNGESHYRIRPPSCGGLGLGCGWIVCRPDAKWCRNRIDNEKQLWRDEFGWQMGFLCLSTELVWDGTSTKAQLALEYPTVPMTQHMLHLSMQLQLLYKRRTIYLYENSHKRKKKTENNLKTHLEHKKTNSQHYKMAIQGISFDTNGVSLACKPSSPSTRNYWKVKLNITDRKNVCFTVQDGVGCCDCGDDHVSGECSISKKTVFVTHFSHAVHSIAFCGPDWRKHRNAGQSFAVLFIVTVPSSSSNGSHNDKQLGHQQQQCFAADRQCHQFVQHLCDGF